MSALRIRAHVPTTAMTAREATPAHVTQDTPWWMEEPFAKVRSTGSDV